MRKIAQSKVHFVGVGGIGMSGIAEVLVNLGAKVSGSDLKESPRTEHLKKCGVQIFIGHDKENVSDVDVLVFSSAVKKDNPELIEAVKREIPLISRAEALSELMRTKRGVAIAGTHGKTTTTSMVAHIFDTADRNPTVVSGGVVLRFGTTAKLGTGEWFIAEADESDGSFDKLSPEISVITNVDNDHLEHYGSFENLLKAYKDFANKIPFYGSILYCGDDRDCSGLFRDFDKKAISFGFGEENDFYLVPKGRQGVFVVFHKGEELGEMHPTMPGTYNALNALAAMVVAFRAGIDFETIKKGIESFEGVQRRFEIKGDFDKQDILVVDDYAHHPTEVMAVLSACKKKYLGRRVRCIFQPHRYSRLQTCWEQFRNVFDMADEVFMLPVYRAGEAPIKGYESEDLANAVSHDVVSVHNDGFDALVNQLVETQKEGDLFITLGAGDVNKISQMLADIFESKEP